MSTFSHQIFLPNLPLPGLEETIDKYLKALVPIVSQEELLFINSLCQKFANSEDAQKLQNFLEIRSGSLKNWLEEWWYEAYTANRETLLTQNMGAIIPKSFIISGKKLSQVGIASQLIHHVMSYWELVRKEKIETTKSRGAHWDMSQIYNLFNACRVPAIPKDNIERYFCTESEGSCPSHIIILCNGHIWKFDPLQNGQILSLHEIRANLENIKEKSAKTENESVVKLTTLGRDTWAEIRTAIIANNDKNAENFKTIESSVFCLTLSEDLVENDSQLMKYSVMGSPLNAYLDKNLNFVVLRDGKTCILAEHANVDAISLFGPCDFAGDLLQDNPEEVLLNITYSSHRKIEFSLSGSLLSRVLEAEEQFSALSSKTNVNVYHYSNFGSTFCKSRKLYADTIIQIALQMAFFKTHKRLAPTYETASTRKFYHGRTETMRSLTHEMAKYLEACEHGVTNEALCTMFFDAYNSHNTLMDAAREARGIDRHFLGLRKAQEFLNKMGENLEIPFLDHPSFTASGGNGNFLLSTSFLGYHENGCFGYVLPMCTNGYGTFYRINSDSLAFTLVNFLNDSTNGDEFCENLEYSLDFIKNVILAK